MKFPYLTTPHIDQAAHYLLVRALGAEPEVPVDLRVILFDCLAEEERLAFNDEVSLGYSDGDKILGSTYPVRGLIEICASLQQPHLIGRYRFTVAHEIGHWVLHRPTLSSGGRVARSLPRSGMQRPADHSEPRCGLPERAPGPSRGMAGEPIRGPLAHPTSGAGH